MNLNLKLQKEFSLILHFMLISKESNSINFEGITPRFTRRQVAGQLILYVGTTTLILKRNLKISQTLFNA